MTPVRAPLCVLDAMDARELYQKCDGDCVHDMRRPRRLCAGHVYRQHGRAEILLWGSCLNAYQHLLFMLLRSKSAFSTACHALKLQAIL